MTDTQIIKALMCLTKDNPSCDDRLHCYFMFKKTSCFNCHHEVAKNALALINRQKAEIEKLKSRWEKMLNEADVIYEFLVDVFDKNQTAEIIDEKEMTEEKR